MRSFNPALIERYDDEDGEFRWVHVDDYKRGTMKQYPDGVVLLTTKKQGKEWWKCALTVIEEILEKLVGVLLGNNLLCRSDDAADVVDEVASLL